MNRAVPAARNDFLTGQLDWLTGTWRAQLVDDLYVFDTDHVYLADVDPARRVADPVDIVDRTATDGIAFAAAVAFEVPVAQPYAGLWVWHDTGVEGTSRLIVWHDNDRNRVPLVGVGDVQPVAVGWSPTLGVFKI